MDHKFVDIMPSELEEDVLYISLKYNVTKHLCACGCGSEIVAMLSPVRWQLHYDGETVSLTPSIGNWYHECRSHYFITKDEVVWANSMSEHKIKAAKQKDQKELNEYNNTKKEGFFKRIKNKILKS